jgi:multiple sugar transport system permease protein
MNRLPRDKSPYLLLLPWIAVFAVFWLFPLVYSLFLSFTDYSTLNNTYSWIGGANYAALFRDSGFQRALVNTIIFSVGTIPFIVAGSLGIAVLLDSVKALQGFYRSVIFFPSITSLVVVALVFTNLYSRGGYLAGLCSLAGIPYPSRGLLLEPLL